jgi:hypothetical protein
MSRQRSLNAGLLAFGVIVVLAGCGTAPTKARREDFQSTDTFSREYSTTPAQTCEAGKRALMSQGYLIDKADSGTVTGHKNFEQVEDNSHTQIQFQVVCSPSDSAALGSTAFVNAVQDRYTIKRSSTAASVGVTILGSVSMPFGSSPDSLVKVASETISRPEFYDGFFTLLKRNLPRASEDEGKANRAAASKKAKEEKAPVVAPKSTPEPALTPAAAGLSTAPAKPTDSGNSSGGSPSSGSSSGSSSTVSGSQAPGSAATSPSGVTAPAAPPKATAPGSSTGASAPAAGGPATPSAGNTGSSVGGSSSGTTGASTKTSTGSSATATSSSAADTKASTGSSTTPSAADATDPGPSSGSSSAQPTPSSSAP